MGYKLSGVCTGMYLEVNPLLLLFAVCRACTRYHPAGSFLWLKRQRCSQIRRLPLVMHSTPGFWERVIQASLVALSYNMFKFKIRLKLNPSTRTRLLCMYAQIGFPTRKHAIISLIYSKTFLSQST